MKAISIAVIAVVLAGTIYFYPHVIDRTTRKRTKEMLSDLDDAVRAYLFEYNRLPVKPDVAAVELTFDGSPDSVALLRILTGANEALGSRENANPREIIFFEPDKSVEGRTLGIVYVNQKPFKLLDVWGQPIHIILDGDYDGRIRNPESESFDPLTQSIITWSDGSPQDEDDSDPWANNPRNW